MRPRAAAAYVWLASLACGGLLGFLVGGAICYTFPEFCAGLATSAGRTPGLEEEIATFFIGSMVLGVLFTLLIRWFLNRWLFAEPEPKENRGGWWPSPRN